MQTSLKLLRWLGSISLLALSLTASAQTVVTISAVDPIAVEPAMASGGISTLPDRGLFVITRSGDTNLPLIVAYTIEGTATSGSDYTALTGEATIRAGARRAEIVVNPLIDNVQEGRETVIASLVEPACIAIFPPPPDCYHVGEQSNATVSILDPVNLPPTVRITAPVRYQSFALGTSICIRATSSDPDGYAPRAVFFADGLRLGLQEIQFLVPPTNGTPIEFAYTWTNAPAGPHVLTVAVTDNNGAHGGSFPVPVTVESPAARVVVELFVTDPDAAEPSTIASLTDPVPGTNPGRCRIVRNGPTNLPLDVFYLVGGTASNGMDFVSLPGRVRIEAGHADAAIEVVPLDDPLPEPIETVILKIVPPPLVQPADPTHPLPSPYVPGMHHIGIIAIHDNDAPIVNRPPVVRVNTPVPGQVFPPEAPITIRATSIDIDGYCSHADFFADDRKIGEQDIAFLTAPPDGSPVVFEFVWTNAPAGPHVLSISATDDLGARGRSAPVGIFVESAFPDTVVELFVTDPEASEPTPEDPELDRPLMTDTGRFKVTRRGSTDLALDVFYHIAGTAINGIDYERLPSHVRLEPGQSEASIEVIPLDDSLPERTESVVLSLTTPPALPQPEANEAGIVWPLFARYRIGAHRAGAVAIRDNDNAENRPPIVKIVNPPSGSVLVTPSTNHLFAHAFDADGQVRSVEFFDGARSLGIAEADPLLSGPLNPFHITWVNPTPGAHTLMAVATDNNNLTGRSAPVYVRVVESLPPPDMRPVVTIRARDPIGSEASTFRGTPTAEFVVERSGPTNAELVVFLKIGGSAVNGEDYTIIEDHLLIPEGTRRATILIQPVDDAIREPLETVHLMLIPPDGLEMFPGTSDPASPYLLGRHHQAAAVIFDNDSPQTPPPPFLRVDDGNFYFSQRDTPTGCFRVEASSDLVRWEIIDESATIDGAAHIVDPDGALFPHRFYRVIPVPCPEADTPPTP